MNQTVSTIEDQVMPQEAVHSPVELSIVVPTFNERDNVERLIEGIEHVLPNIKWEIIFIDDDSPDGTADFIRKIAQSKPYVRCQQRIGRRGLSKAVIEGILSSSAPVIVVMTAIYVAKQLGIFENYGYDARVLVLEPRAGIGALLSGDLDCYTAIGSTARAALRGAPVRVGLVSLNRSDFILVANKEITSIEQLRGKVIGGYTPQGTVNVVLGELLRRKGLRPEEYKVVNAGTARAAALSSGSVTVAMLNSVETVRMDSLAS